MNKLPKFVSGRLVKPNRPQLVHPDADLLTAFLEQKVTRSEREQVFAHLSECSICREVVTLAAPEIVAISAAPVTQKGALNWLQWPGMRWAAVAIGSVVVLAVGIALRPTLSDRGTVQPATEVVLQKQKSATAPLADKITSSKTSIATSAADERKEPASKSPQKNRELEARNEINNLTGTVGALADRKIAPSAKYSFEKDDAQRSAHAQEKKQLSKLNQPVESTSQSAAIPAESAPLPRSAAGSVVGGLAASTPRTDRDRVVQNQSVDVNGNAQQRKFVIQPQQQTQGLARAQQPADAFTASAPAPAPTASSSVSTELASNAQAPVDQEAKKEAVAGPLTLETRRAGKSKAVMPNLRANGFGGLYNGGTLKVSAGQAVSWKISPEGKLLRKSSHEDSWKTVELPSAGTLHSLASNNLDVWVGGAPLSGESSGALFHTIDGGEHWQRVNGPWTGDILALQSSSAHNSVTVRTAGGEWQSQDAGVNWIRTR